MKNSPRSLSFFFPLSFLLTIFSCPSLFATTYVIQENGVEVGRWDEADGSDKVEIVDGDKPKPQAEKVTSAKPISGEVGYPWTEAKVPENVQKFKIGGRVVDIMNLRPVAADKILFTGGGIDVPAPVSKDGVFKVELPKLDKGGYMVRVDAAGYAPGRNFILENKSFRAGSQKERALLCQRIPQMQSISAAVYQIEVGLCRNQMSKEERKIYQDEMTRVSAGA